MESCEVAAVWCMCNTKTQLYLCFQLLFGSRIYVFMLKLCVTKEGYFFNYPFSFLISTVLDLTDSPTWLYYNHIPRNYIMNEWWMPLFVLAARFNMFCCCKDIDIFLFVAQDVSVDLSFLLILLVAWHRVLKCAAPLLMLITYFPVFLISASVRKLLCGWIQL